MEMFVQSAQVGGVADEQVTRVIGRRFGSECLERDFGADPGDVTERNADPASHCGGGFCERAGESRSVRVFGGNPGSSAAPSSHFWQAEKNICRLAVCSLISAAD